MVQLNVREIFASYTSEAKARVGWGNFRREHWELIWADYSTQQRHTEGWSGKIVYDCGADHVVLIAI